MLEESASAIQSSLWASMNSWFTPTVLFLFLNLMIGTIVFTSTQKHHQTNSQQNDNTTNQPHNNNSNNIARSPSPVLQRLKSINFYSHYRSQEPPQTSSLVHRKQIPDSDTLFNVDHTSSYQQDHPTQSRYFFEDSSQENLENPLLSQAHYVFQQTHEDNPQETQASYVLEQTHEENHQETETHFVLGEKDSTFDDFQLALEEESEQSMDEVYSQVTGSNFSRTKSDTEPAGGEIPAKLPAKMRKSASLKSPFGHFEEEVIVEARRPATVREKGNAKVTDGDEEVDAKADDFINKFKHQLKLQRLDSIIRYKDMIGRATVGE